MGIGESPLIGVIHLPRLSVGTNHQLSEIITYANEEAKKLEQCDFSAIIVENYNDAPFAKTQVSDYVFSKLSIIIHEMKKSTSLPIGVNILRNACLQAYIIASIQELEFIRCNVWESAYVTDQGMIEGVAHEVINCKNQLSSSVKVFADIHVKHAIPLGSSNLLETAKNALYRGKADHVIVSGDSTGTPPSALAIKELSDYGIYPFIGSGLSIKNLLQFAPYIGGAIVGTSIKKNFKVTNPIDTDLAISLVREWKEYFSK